MRMKQEERKFIELVERLMERWGYDRTGEKYMQFFF